ncbi:MAG: ABC transporter substrate-binding protein [Alphaproteobacteria bacterium]|nr:ABC transporter substrate-binding protein [Alphaproteobacteria bacterium]
MGTFASHTRTYALFAVTFVVLASLSIYFYFEQHQQMDLTSRVFVIGAMRLTEVDDRTLDGFKDGLEEMGWQIGKDVVVKDNGTAGSIDRLDAMAAAHVADGVDLIFVSSTPATQAAKRATAGTGIPVVFSPVNDPVGAGVVENLMRPGGNVTGIKLPLGDDVRLQWLTKIAPKARRVFVPYTVADDSSRLSLSSIRGASVLLGLELVPYPVESMEHARVVASEMPSDVDAVFIPRDSAIEAAVDAFVNEAIRRKIPVSAPSYTQVEAGALYCYGFIHSELGKAGAVLAHKILRGANPATTPVEMGRSLLSLNLRTAKLIGLDIPDSILRQAAKVIR